jgi:hypothetical protein
MDQGNINKVSIRRITSMTESVDITASTFVKEMEVARYINKYLEKYSTRLEDVGYAG